MWMIFAFASAFFAGITAILSKVGVKNINSNLATAVRTTVVFVFAWLLAAVRGTLGGIADINAENGGVPRAVGTCDGCVVALLFQGTAKRRRQ